MSDISKQVNSIAYMISECLNVPKGLSPPSPMKYLLLVVSGEELTMISCTKSSVKNLFITGSGTDVSATFIRFENDQSPSYLYSEPQSLKRRVRRAQV